MLSPVDCRGGRAGGPWEGLGLSFRSLMISGESIAALTTYRL